MNASDAQWYADSDKEWELQAQLLEVNGYTRQADRWYPAVFVKPNSVDLVLVRDFGRLNWHPVKRGEEVAQ